MRAAIDILRIPHWIKNVVVLFPVVFSLHGGDWTYWGRAAVAMAAFCLTASAFYIFNDIRDRRIDRLHPAKASRPLPSGRLSVSAAAIEAVVLLLAAAALTVWLGVLFALFLGGYVALQLAYNVSLRRHMIVDVICLGVGFVLRAAGGAAAIDVNISPWLVVCTFTLCLFMGFCKRHSEGVAFDSPDAAGEHRRTLLGYTPGLLTHLITLSGSVAVVTFLLYSTNQRTIDQFGTNFFIYTLPLVFYGICRFAMLSMQGRHQGPTELLLRDRPLQATIVLWIVAAVIITTYGRDIQNWALRQ